MNQIDTTRSLTRTIDEFKCIYLIRHGECVSNIEWPIENYSDEMDGLTARGRDQAFASAKLLEKTLRGWKRDTGKVKLYSSTLLRARETAAIINSHLCFPEPISFDPRLIEYGGENEGSNQFEYRLDSVLTEFESLNHDVVAICHGHTMQGFLAACVGSRHNAFDASVSNGGLSIFHGRTLIHWNMEPETESRPLLGDLNCE